MLGYRTLRFPNHDTRAAMKNILIVEAEPHMAPVLQPVLEAYGFAVHIADRREAVVAHLERCLDQAVVINLENLKHEGLAIAGTVRALCPDLAIITLNTPATIDLSIQAMRMGVFDDLLMPLNVDQFIASIRRAVGAAAGTIAQPALKPAIPSRSEGDLS